jgi:uncharacterized protein YihD (DUF1040 family)
MSGGISAQYKSCESCQKMNICKVFAQAAGFELQFTEAFGDIAKLPFPAKLLALNCKEYQNVVEQGRLDWVNEQALEAIPAVYEIAKKAGYKATSEELNLVTLCQVEMNRRKKESETLATT